MITDKDISRINALSKKSKTPEGLTEEEKKEQIILRKKYVEAFKRNLRAQLDQIKIVDNSHESRLEIEEKLDSIETEIEEVKNVIDD